MKYAKPSDGKVALNGLPEVDALNGTHSDKADIEYVGPIGLDYPELALEGVHYHRTDNSLTSKRASKYVRRILHAINRHLLKEGGIRLKYRDLDIGEMEKPEFTITEDGRIGYVLGYYDTSTKKLKLNPYLDEKTLEKVTLHEILHYVQDKLGVIGYCEKNLGKKAVPAIENSADYMVEKLLPEISEAREPLPGKYRAFLN